MKSFKLNREEKEILKSINRGEWKAVPRMRREIRLYQQVARAQLRKDQRVNIRLSSFDLRGIQRKAMDEGIPYQTLMASVIHKYVSGRLLERKHAA